MTIVFSSSSFVKYRNIINKIAIFRTMLSTWKLKVHCWSSVTPRNLQWFTVLCIWNWLRYKSTRNAQNAIQSNGSFPYSTWQCIYFYPTAKEHLIIMVYAFSSVFVLLVIVSTICNWGHWKRWWHQTQRDWNRPGRDEKSETSCYCVTPVPISILQPLWNLI